MRVEDYPAYLLDRLREQQLKRLRKMRSKFIPNPQGNIFDLIEQKREV